jgi:hypothetical protein
MTQNLTIANVTFSIFFSADKDKDKEILFDQDILNFILFQVIVEDVFNDPLRNEGAPICSNCVRDLGSVGITRFGLIDLCETDGGADCVSDINDKACLLFEGQGRYIWLCCRGGGICESVLF